MAKGTILRVKNKTGATIPLGKVVYISGFDKTDQTPLISVASCDDESKMPAIGVLLEDAISGTNIVNVRIAGVATGFDTNEVDINTNVYVGVNGGLLFSIPDEIDSDYLTQQLGVVLSSEQEPMGQIEIFPLEIKKRTNHSLLNNLDSDDHLIYILADGSRDFTGAIIGVDPVLNQHLATKHYVDTHNSGFEGGGPEGADGLIQYNNDGYFGGTTGLYWDDLINRLNVNGSLIIGGNIINKDLTQTFQTIRQACDGYSLNEDISSLHSKDTELSTAINTIIKDLDGYIQATRDDNGNWDAGNFEIHAENLEGRNEGLLTAPIITDAGGLTLNITSVDVLIRSDVNWEDGLLYRAVPAISNLSVTNNATNWIIVNWNNGNPIYQAVTSNETINNSTIIPVARIFMYSGTLDYQVLYGTVGRSASIRNFDRIMRIRGIGGTERESGFAITETATRIVNVAFGVVWFGVNRISLGAIVQGGSGVLSDLWYHSGGSWTKTTITQYNNTQYDDGNNLVSLGVGKYTINWIFRNITSNEIDIVLGTGNYNSAQAEASLLPPLPPAITGFYVLCGRIIVQNGADTAYAIENVSINSFQSAATTDHGDLSGLTDDDHVQYLLANGTRTLTGNLTISGTIINDSLKTALDGYALITDISSLDSRDTELAYAINTIKKDLDGYITTTGTATDGYVAFFGGNNKIAGDNDLYWDRINNRLGIHNTNPTTELDVNGIIKATIGNFNIVGVSGYTCSNIYGIGADNSDAVYDWLRYDITADSTHLQRRAFSIGGDKQYGWYNSTGDCGFGQLLDAGLARVSPRVVKITDGGLGRGSLELATLDAYGEVHIPNGSLITGGSIIVGGNIINKDLTQAFQTIRQACDGYTISTGITGDGYVTFFTGNNKIAGDNDLFWDRENNILRTNKEITIGPESDRLSLKKDRISSDVKLDIFTSADLNIESSGGSVIIYSDDNMTLSTSGYVDVDSKQIKLLADPTDPQDAVTKYYTDSNVASLHSKDTELSNAINTIKKDLDGYASTGSTGDGYITFFTGTNIIAGDNDLYWDRENNKLQVNKELDIGSETDYIKIQQDRIEAITGSLLDLTIETPRNFYLNAVNGNFKVTAGNLEMISDGTYVAGDLFVCREMDLLGEMKEVTTGTGSYGDGYIAFFTGTNNVAGDNDLYWDRVNNRLGIHKTNPTVELDVNGAIKGVGQWTDAGVTGTGGAFNGNGVVGQGTAGGAGGYFTGGASDGRGVQGLGIGSGAGGYFTGGTEGRGITCISGGIGYAGGHFTGGAGAPGVYSVAGSGGMAIIGYGNGVGQGGYFVGGATAASGVYSEGGATNGKGIEALGKGTGAGVYGTGGTTDGYGGLLYGGATNGVGVEGIGAGTGAGAVGLGGLSGHGVIAKSQGVVKAAFRIVPQASAPSSPLEGDVYCNSVDHHMYFYNGTTWKQLDN